MKIAILGSAPSSLSLAPFGDETWKIWGCSPGVYPFCPRADAWFELHRWEPGVVGKPETQKPWFSPEYVLWMAQREPNRCPVWMAEPVPQIPASRRLPIDDLTKKYGTYFFTSSISIMIACAIEDILEERAARAAAVNAHRAANPGEPINACAYEPDVIGLWGVDMAANEEYGYQRAGCQHMLLLAGDLGIKIQCPPESDLLRPMPIYGISESSWWMIKNTARRRELEGRLSQATQQLEAAKHNVAFLQGGLDDLNYQMQTWCEDREGVGVHFDIQAQNPYVRQRILEQLQAEQPATPPTPVVETPAPKKAPARTRRKR